MKKVTYLEIKNRINKYITLNNGYQYDDLIHDTIEKLLRTKKKDKDCLNICIKVARNLVINHYRKAQKFILVYDKQPELEYYQTERKTINEPIINKELFILRYKLGMSYIEMSEYTKRPIGTIKTQMYKVHKELKELNR